MKKVRKCRKTVFPPNHLRRFNFINISFFDLLFL